MRRRTYYYESQAYFDAIHAEAMRRTPSPAKVEELRRLEAAPPAQSKYIDFPVKRPGGQSPAAG